MTAPFDALARSLARVCLAPSPPAADLAALGDAPARWSVYRDLVRGRIALAVSEALPRCRDAAGSVHFEAWLARWLDEAPPRGRYVRELMPEFADWLCTAGALDDTVPRAFHDLLRFERALHRVALAEDPPPERLHAEPFAMDRPARFHPNLLRLDVTYEVQRAAPASDLTALAAPCALLLYRDAARFTAETLVLTPLAARVVDAMLPGDRDVAGCVLGALAAQDHRVSSEFIEGFSGLLATLMERGLLLGSTP